MKFSSYSLNKEFVEALNKLNYVDLTEVQEKTLATLLKGKSLIAKSATGSGKTHAYLVPLIQNLDSSFIGVQGLILVPTTELALQVGNFISDLEKLYPYFHAISLTSIREKEEALAKLKNLTKPTILVATPGRVEDIFFNSKKSFSYKINTIVFDEADMLFEDSYMESIYRVYDSFKPKQVMVFTATMKEHRIADIKKMLHVNNVIETSQIRTADNVRHILLDIRHLSKVDALIKYLSIVKPFFGLVFCSSKKDIEEVYDKLNDLGIRSTILTGGLESRQRKAVLKQLDSGEINLLLASDVASRGIDFKDVSHVISLDIPTDLDYYYHRAGRTGRYNKTGTSSELFASTGSSTLESSINNDIALMMVLANKFSLFLTNLINRLYENSNINFKYTILPISYYNENKYVDTSFKLASSGYSLLLPSLALGFSQKDLGNIKDLENEVLDLDEKLIPPKTSYTQNNEQNPGGAPKKEESEKSPKTLENEKSLDNQTGGDSD